MTPHPELELAGSYALGSLDGDDLAGFEAHLPSCAACRALVAEFQELYVEGELAPPPLTPSPQLKQRLLDRIERPPPAEAASAPRSTQLVWIGAAFGALVLGLLAILLLGRDA